MQTLLGKHWHHLPAAEVVRLLDSNAERGLDRFEAERRIKHFGPNRLTPSQRKSALMRFLAQFNNPLLYILIAAALVTAVLKSAVDGAVIFGVVLINALIGYLQEARAERAIEALTQAMSTEAVVLRAGEQRRIPAEELVPGDLVLLAAGDKIPADLRLLRVRDLQLAEAALTGESVPVLKHNEDNLPEELMLAERRNMAYAATFVTAGQGLGVVVATGDNTEIGRISRLIAEASNLETPLTRNIAAFSKLLLYAILALAALTFLIGVGLYRQPPVEAMLAAITLAVGAIPEGLPAALTITLAIGVARMARRQAIIRKLPAVEALGSVTVICSDKTGTLTQNQMTVQQALGALDRCGGGRACYTFSGLGYNPQGKVQVQDQPVSLSDDAALREVLTAGALCNDAGLVLEDGRWNASGDPTEAALLVSARKAGLDLAALAAAHPRVDVIPFDSQNQYMGTLHAFPEGQRLYVKGGVEAVLLRCVRALDAAGQPVPLDVGAIHTAVDEMAARGLRVLAFARRDLPAAQTQVREDDVERLTFLGLQGMMDPPRLETAEAVRKCQQAGIRVKMITGDHALTARAIAHQISLVSDPQAEVLTGEQLARLSDDELIEAAVHTDVFARVSPEQKLRLVEALQARGNVVAMTGDGVNDAPALRQADIGVAMGITGTEVAKEAAEMVLTDDNFATIQAAVEEGRGIFDNLTKIIAWVLPTNLGLGLIILLATFLNVPLPVLPIQVLWINMTIGGVLGLVLALEPKEPDILLRKPRDPRASILNPVLLGRVVIVGLLVMAGAFGLYEWQMLRGVPLTEARTVAINAVAWIMIFYLFNCRSLTQSMFAIGVFSNRWVWIGVGVMVVLQAAFTYLPVMNHLFDTVPISVLAWAEILAVSLLAYGGVELEKSLRRRGQ